MSIRALSRTRAARRAVGVVGLAVTTVAAGACGDDGTSPRADDAALTGRYTLASYAGQPLPAVIDEEPGVVRFELLDGTIELGADRRFVAVVRSRDTDLSTGVATVTTDMGTGSWTPLATTAAGRTVRFVSVTDGEADTTIATVRDGVLTVRDPFLGGDVVYRR